MPHVELKNPEIFKERRDLLIESIRQEYPDQVRSGVVLLFGAFEHDRHAFKQDASFYYFTGIEEPAAALLINLENNQTTLYFPNYGGERKKWIKAAIDVEQEEFYEKEFDSIEYLGEPCQGYQCHPFFTQQQYTYLLKKLSDICDEKKLIFTLNPSTTYAYIEQRYILQRIVNLLPKCKDSLIDISSLVAKMRRKKSNAELELLYKAVSITMEAHAGAATSIVPDKIEYEVQALIEYLFIAMGGSVAFPSIVASGINSTILHYYTNNDMLKNGELVVVDIGAEYNYYCADLTRTYPVSGKFSSRQREVYEVVLETQEYIESIAQPGYWLSNKEQPDKSLHHLAQEFLKSKGYDRYFIHGIGHFLGLEVHDVGNYQDPLQPGDVITIEPGIYLPEEQIGVRIEDNYWIIPDGNLCLSQELPKKPDEIEALMKMKAE